MVPTLFNSSLPESPWCGAAFARENLRQKQRSAAKCTLLYNRARYYDPQTGEFISRDPLEYVDGMSLYRGYFVPGGMDPAGTQDELPLPPVGHTFSELTAINIIREAWRQFVATENQDLIQRLRDGGCPFPEIDYDPNTPFGQGSFNSGGNQINLGIGGVGGMVGQLTNIAIDVLKHELLHAVDHCENEISDCRSRACLEIRGSSFGQCTRKADFKMCVELDATDSLVLGGHCQVKRKDNTIDDEASYLKAARTVRELLETCILSNPCEEVPPFPKL